MRTFVIIRRMATEYEELRKRIEDLETDIDAQFSDVDIQFKEIYEALTVLLSEPQKKERPRIGFIKTEE